MHEGNVELRKARDDERLRERGIKTLVGDAVAVEHDAVSLLERKLFLSRHGQGQTQAKQSNEESSFHRWQMLRGSDANQKPLRRQNFFTRKDPLCCAAPFSLGGPRPSVEM